MRLAPRAIKLGVQRRISKLALISLSVVCPAHLPSPVPEITWRKLDGELPLGHKVETAGAHLHLYNVQVEDGGTYQCEAVNSKGKDYHSARVSVEGMQRVAYPHENISNIKTLLFPINLEYCCFQTQSHLFHFF